ncbi:hypothetical protein TSAR_015325, partial [Trichomalopsis sarcophagae]
MSNSVCKRRKIKIIRIKDDSVRNVFVEDDKLKKITIEDYFSGEGNLTYKDENGEICFLRTDEQFFYLETGIDTYIFNEKQNSTGRLEKNKKRQLNDILEDLYKQRDPDRSSKKLTKTKISNKKQKLDSSSSNDEEECLKVSRTKTVEFLNRNIKVGWRHRVDSQSSYKYMGASIGPTVLLHLNGREDYPLDKLKQCLLEKYVTEANKAFFYNSSVEVGNSSCVVIESYYHDGKLRNFWEYCRLCLRKSNHALTVYLLTTEKPFNLSDFPDCSFLKQDYRNKITDSTSTSKGTIASKASVINKNMDENTHAINKTDKSNSNILMNKCDYCKIISNETITSKAMDKSAEEKVTNAETTVSKIFKIPTMSKICAQNNEKESRAMKEININVLEDNASNESDIEKSIGSPAYSQLTTEKKSTDCDSIESYFENARYNTFDIKKLKLSIPFIKEKDIEFSGIMLGSGAQGIVTKGKYRGSSVAIKSVQKGRNDNLIFKEVQLLNKIRHPNIVSIMAWTTSYTQFHILMELFESYSLFELLMDPKIKKLHKLTVRDKIQISQQIACALTFLHLHPEGIILHRDIKPGNILCSVPSCKIKLCDLGLGKSTIVNTSFQTVRENAMRGTYLFMAPEIILENKSATTATDVWAFVCTMVELFSEKSVWPIEEFDNGWSC